jgi:hypothetical protein
VGSAAVAALHVAIVFIGAPGYRYFGAGERLAGLAERGSPYPGSLTLALASIFAMWALYAFSGAGAMRQLPLLRTGLLVIGAIYTLRGLPFIVQIILTLRGMEVPMRQTVFSFVSLVIGVLYLWGTVAQWRVLATPAGRGPA